MLAPSPSPSPTFLSKPARASGRSVDLENGPPTTHTVLFTADGPSPELEANSSSPRLHEYIITSGCMGKTSPARRIEKQARAPRKPLTNVTGNLDTKGTNEERLRHAANSFEAAAQSQIVGLRHHARRLVRAEGYNSHNQTSGRDPRISASDASQSRRPRTLHHPALASLNSRLYTLEAQQSRSPSNRG